MNAPSDSTHRTLSQRASDLDPLHAPLHAAPGHFDELRERTAAQDPVASSGADTTEAPDSIADVWERFFRMAEDDGLGNMSERALTLERQIRDNGVTYNVYADENGPQRPWSLGLFPLIISPKNWQHIEAGITQRVRLLDRVMADVYGKQELLSHGLLPAALVQGHPGYVRAMHGVTPVGGCHLHIAAFDLARGPDGNWWVVSQRTQAPSGLGYLLENRIAISRLFPHAFENMQVQRLASTYSALINSIKSMCPAGQDAHIALLTPGPYNETYFEHAYLARYLGITLVEGNDLIVRDQHLFLKTLRGLVPVHGLLKRLDDQFLDPLELRADSTLGVPGLLQVIRAGNVLVANAPGSAFLESTALLGFMPALSRHLLGEELLLPALPTWWCGERAAMDAILPRLNEFAIKPTYPGSTLHGDFDAVLGHSLAPRELDEWAGRIALHADDHTVQAYMPLSQIPTLQSDGAAASIVPRSVMLRVFAVSQGTQSWRILPGGLARVAGGSADVASMQHGGSSADVWALTTGAVDRTSLQQPPITTATLALRKRQVTSRAAESLFWLGRYTERAENCVRLARLTLECLGGEDQTAEPLLSWLGQLAQRNNLVLAGVPALTPAPQARRVFERSLIASLNNSQDATSVGYNLRAVRLAGSAVRERLSQEHWNLMQRTETAFCEGIKLALKGAEYSPLQALDALKVASDQLAAITGLQTDRMTRDDGWRLLSIGRHIERLVFLSSSLRAGFDTGSVHHEGGFEAMVALFDSTITFHAQYQQSHDIVALVDLLVLDRDNPRSLGWVVHTLRGRLAKLAGSAPDQLSLLSHSIPDPDQWNMEQLCEPDALGGYTLLVDLLQAAGEAAYQTSEEIGATYFTHSSDSGQSLGA